MLHQQKIRTTAGRGRLFDSILDTVGDTPAIRVNNLGARPCDDLREGRVLQPGGVGQGPAGAQHHRGGRAQRRAEAGPDRGRGDQRQHRHRARDGLRAEGLSAGRDDGRQFLDRAPQADAHAGRQGGADAARARRASACTRRRSNWPRPMAGSSPASSRPRPMPTFTRRRPRARSSMISPDRGSTTSSPATAPAARSSGVGARAAPRAAGDPDRAGRARERAARRQRPRAGARRRRRAGRQPSGLRAASDPGLDAGLHPERAAGGDRRRPL